MRLLDVPGRSTVHAPVGMAATSQPLSTMAAIQILQAGGNAMDAAIAAVAVQCVVEPQSTGIGGDCFCLYSPKSEGIIAFNGSGRAPAGATAEWYAENGIRDLPRQSPHSVTVPGAVDAWAQLSADHGIMPLGDVLEPAIRYARDGFAVNHRVSFDWARNEDILARDPASAEHYLKDGKAYELGDKVRLPLLARTLEEIAARGRAGFYEGWVADDMVGFLSSLGGHHTRADFDAAVGEYVEPIKTAYKGHEVWECPPNGQGIVALEMLNILGGMELDKLDPLSAERLHIEIEAARLAYCDREAVLADPAQSDVPVGKWLSGDYADEQRALIDRTRRMPALPPSPLAGHQDTVYLCVVDKDRNAVSFINTLFMSFGSALTAPRSGVLLHNRGQGFVLDPGHPNCIAPGKRPMHTIIPGMVTKDGRTVMPFGVMGGHYQACGHAHFLTNLFEWEMDLQEAIDFTRVFPDVADPDGRVQVESGLPEGVRRQLEDMGHETYLAPSPIGGAQAIWIDWERGVLKGASEPRKDGLAIGY